MATVTKPIALDESFNTTEVTPRNIADVLADELSRITGRNASQVEYDNTESGLDAENVQDALDEINGKIPTVPSVDIQTAVDEFETYNGGLLSSLKVSLTPNQDLHGYDSPWVGGSKKNKLPLVLADIKPLNTNGTWSGNVYTIYTMTYTVYTDDGGNVTEIEANGTPTSNAQLNLTNNTTFLSGSFIGNGCPSGGGDNKYRIRFAGGLNGNDYGSQSSTMTADPNTAINVYIRVDAGVTADHLKFYPMLRLSTESDPTFEPYSNICPISGHTEVDVDVSDGQATQEQITVNLGGTYYSGTLDVVTGLFTPDTAKAVSPKRGALDSSGKLYTINFSGGTIHNYTDTGIATPYVMCSHLDIDSLAGARDTQRKCICQYAGAVYIGGYVGEEAALDSMLASADFSIVFELATPTPIQLSPTMVKALVGENHLSTPLEGQEITESKYRELFTWDEVESYVNAHSGSGSGMNYSTEEQVIGTWIDNKPLYQKTVDQTIGSDADYTVFANGIDHAHLVNSIFEYSSGRWFSSGYTSIGVTSNSRTCYVEVQNGALNLHNQSNSSIHWIATIQYTKTTD